MKLAVIVPTWNRSKNLEKTIKCLLAQDVFETHHNVSIYIIDDDSQDNTEHISRSYPVNYFKHTPHTEWNASKPRNFGAILTPVDTDLLYFVDSDVLLPPDRIRRLIETWEPNPLPNRVMIGPYHFSRNDIDVDAPKWFEKEQQNYDGDIRWKLFEEHEPIETNTGLQYALACFGGSLAVNRWFFFKAGGFDEEMLSGVEDGDFGLTMWETGAVFSVDRGLLGWHNPHAIHEERVKFIKPCVEKLNKKHNIDIVHATGGVYRQWGIDWKPPESWVDQSGYKKEELI